VHDSCCYVSFSSLLHASRKVILCPILVLLTAPTAIALWHWLWSALWFAARNTSRMGLFTTRSLIFKFAYFIVSDSFLYFLLHVPFFSVDSSVSTVNRLWTRGPANGVRFPGRAENPFPPQCQPGSVVNPDHSSVYTENSVTGSHAYGA